MILKIETISLIATLMVAPSLKTTSSLSWINEQNTTIVKNGDGWDFSSTTRGDSARLNEEILLDGLSFDYKINNSTQGQKAGFYFNTDKSHSLDNNLCTFTFAPCFADNGAQTRFGIYPNDITDSWFQVKNYPLNQTGVVGKLGFGLDHTLVLDANIDLQINFTFKKVGPFYKITIRQLKDNLIWVTNANYTSDSKGNYVTTYVEATNLPTNNGYVYFHEFGYSSSAAPNIYIGKISETVANTAKVTYHYNQFILVENNKTPVTETITVEKNSLLQLPKDPVNDGYYFAGWYSDSFFSSKWDFENNKVIADLDLYAKWVTDESELKPKTNTGKITDHVVQLSMPVFVILCILGAGGLIALGFLIYFLIKKLMLKVRGDKLLK